MKKLILSLALCCAATNFFAQNTDPAQLVNEGKAALESKNYQLAFTKFSTYLTQTNNQDSVIAFNCGVCADKIKKPADALKYFDIAVQTIRILLSLTTVASVPIKSKNRKMLSSILILLFKRNTIWEMHM